MRTGSPVVWNCFYNKVYCVWSMISYKVALRDAGPCLGIICEDCLHFFTFHVLYGTVRFGSQQSQQKLEWLSNFVGVTLTKVSGCFSNFIFDISAAFVIDDHFYLPKIVLKLCISETIFLVFLLAHWTYLLRGLWLHHFLYFTFVLDLTAFSIWAHSVSWLSYQLCAKNSKPFLPAFIFLLTEILQ